MSAPFPPLSSAPSHSPFAADRPATGYRAVSRYVSDLPLPTFASTNAPVYLIATSFSGTLIQLYHWPSQPRLPPALPPQPQVARESLTPTLTAPRPRGNAYPRHHTPRSAYALTSPRPHHSPVLHPHSPSDQTLQKRASSETNLSPVPAQAPPLSPAHPRKSSTLTSPSVVHEEVLSRKNTSNPFSRNTRPSAMPSGTLEKHGGIRAIPSEVAATRPWRTRHP